MSRKRKSNISQSSDIARAKKVARFNETLPQAELRRLEQADSELLKHQSSPMLGVDVILNIWHLNGLLRHPNSPTLGVFSMQLTWRLREIQKPLKQLNLANMLLLKGHNSGV
ncbi:hypothetical protein TNCV_1113731 [Trichonephila clavipes]|nr:hypothetical protein TNCV_1113731 [Trichonephila clavipes]